MIGKIILQKYQIEEAIGKGGCGQVYRARDLHLNIPVAVKVGHAEGYSRQSLQQEKEMLLSMEHPGMVKMLDFFQEEQHTFLIMEYVEGISMQTYLAEHGVASVEQATDWMLELTSAIAYLHTLRPPVIYRDIKPANIMIRPDRTLKLIDFGTAVRMGSMCAQSRCMNTADRAYRVGTFGYAAPEQLTEQQCRQIDIRADIYALGATFHEILTGNNPCVPPYSKRSIREWNSSLPKSLERIINRCVEKNVDQRYSSAQELGEELQRVKGIERKRNEIQQGKKVVYILLLGLTTASVLLRTKVGGVEIYPVMIILSTLCKLIVSIHEKETRYLKKQEKCIWLTEKKTVGTLFLLAGLIFTGDVITVQAVESAACKPVVLRNEKGQKILIQEGKAYQPVEDLDMELQLEQLPAGKQLTVDISISDEDGNAVGKQSFLLKL